MITAKEAAQLIPRPQNRTTEQICDDIKLLATLGWKRALFLLNTDQVNEFENLGYTVEQSTIESTYSISWGN